LSQTSPASKRNRRVFAGLATASAVTGVVGVATVMACRAQPAPPSQRDPGGTSEPQNVIYEQGPGGPLNLLIWGGGSAGPAKPVIVLFHGGAFRAGDAGGFAQMCDEFHRQSIACVSANYTLSGGERQAQEAKSAVAWVRRHAIELHIAPNEVFVGGGSAGGYLALSTALLSPERDSMPDGLVLFNPVLDWRGNAGPSEDLRADSRARLPPTVIFHGTADQTSPYSDIQAFVASEKSAGSDIGLQSFEGRRHGFFNYGAGNNPDYYTVTKAAVEFIRAHTSGFGAG